MERTLSVSLDDGESGYVDEQLASGRFANATEVVRVGLALLRERDAKLEALRQAIREGLESGDAQPWDVEEFLAEQRRLDDAA